MNKDLTVGNPSTVLWKFCLPMFGSVVFQQLYNIADSLVAGKFVGEAALAAVGNSYEITLIFIAFAFGCNIGCSVIVSRFFGAKQYRDMKTAVTTSLIGCAALVALLMLVGLAGCDALLELINTPEEILADSALYLDIYVLGLPFMFFYNVATGIFSALGDSKTPFFFLAVSSVSNIFMDILFVTAFDMGVAGVAWATFLCQGISCLCAMAAVLLLVKAELADAVAARVEESGVMVVPKPVPRLLFDQALRFAMAARSRLTALRRENMRLEKKLEEMRLVDRAKCALIQYRGMTEQQAHRYLEKKAMDTGKNRGTVAMEVLACYEP